jgi:hypothetical protein
LHANQPA